MSDQLRVCKKNCLWPQESDTDMETALTTFFEVQAKGQAVKYRVIHAQECIQVTLRRDDREIPLDPSVSLPISSGMSKKGKKGKRCSQPINDQSQRKNVRPLLIPLTLC